MEWVIAGVIVIAAISLFGLFWLVIGMDGPHRSW